MKTVLAAALLFLSVACSSSVQPAAERQAATPTPTFASRTPTVSPSPIGVPPLPASKPWVPPPSPIGSEVAPQVLPPAQVMPLAALCSTPVIATADGNFLPLFCRSGAINVDAWRSYATSIGPHIMAAGRDATVQQIDDALRADGALHDTAPEQIYSYTLAAAYYGWKYTPNPACEFIYSTPAC